jgi:glycosyltransferase involved in cell wall biosynthesis
MMMRVLQDHVFKDQRGRPVAKVKNDLINIVQRKVLEDLRARGIIGPPETFVPRLSGAPLPAWCPKKRVGIWLTTTPFYSGGRIHLYQYAWTLMKLGAEVMLITNQSPRWAADYPADHRPHLLIDGKDGIPDDIDLIVTDSKGDVGKRALAYKKSHPRIPFVCFNFETPNWVAGFVPDYAKKLESHPEVFQNANLLIANSRQSAKFLGEWMGPEYPIPIHVIPPAANTSVLDQADSLPPLLDPKRPYAVWSARNAEYKNGRMAMDAILAQKAPFDLWMIGQRPDNIPQATAEHRIEYLAGIPDAQKMSLFKNAAVALAPSLFEGYGMVPAEALCCGTPVIAYDLPVLREEYGDRIIYAKWDDPKDFISKIRGVLENRPKIDAGEARVKYGLPAMEKAIEAVPSHCISKPEISVQLIAYWGFIPESIESIYPYVKEILIAFGRDPNAEEIDDGSWERLQEWIATKDLDRKIRVERREVWTGGKVEMREWCVQHSSGNRMLMLDGDEIWVNLEPWIQGVVYGTPRWVNFWHNLRFWVYDSAELVGRRWGFRVKEGEPGSFCPHYRYSAWRSSYFFKLHHSPVDTDGRQLYDRQPKPTLSIPETKIYHLGHCLPPGIMQAKHEFYLRRDGRDPQRIDRMNCWRKWDGHPGNSGDGIVADVNWPIPEIVQRAYDGMQSWKIKI